jgi:hypothetical protein
MGDVYRNATLVIAAAGAHNSTDGLFIEERPNARVYRLPYIVDGSICGSFKASPLPERNGGLGSSPLNRRAWAYQESYLARRAIHFMRGQIYWTCRGCEIGERSEQARLGATEKRKWLSVLELYTQKQLTYPQDRLYALQGIIDEMQKSRQDSFLFECGVWEEKLDEQIFWRQKESVKENESLDFPTWSWASIGGSKDWSLTEIGTIRLRSLLKSLWVNNHRSLVATGHVTQKSTTFHRIPPEILDKLQGFYTASNIVGDTTNESCPS